MPVSEFTKCKFIVKEGAPSEQGGEAPTFLVCEPISPQASLVDEGNLLTLRLAPGTTVTEAQEVSRYLEEHITGFGITTF